MRGYKIGDTGIIEDVYEKAPAGAKDTYNNEPGVYTETAVNKLVARSVRYQEYVSNKQRLRELDVEVNDTNQELIRIREVLRSTNSKKDEVTEELESKIKLIKEAKQDLEGIQKEIVETLGGVK